MFKKIIEAILPKLVVNKVIEFKNKYLTRYAIKSYSQEGEDMILARLFENQQNGFYVDVGAHHPQRFSNTYFFYKKGWRGINIDAMPGSMNIFNKLRPRDINLEYPISDKDETLTYFAFKDPALNTFDENLARDYFNGGEKIKFKKQLTTKKLDQILEQVLPSNQNVDFLSIDVEGFDYKVLKAIDFTKYKPKVILIEISGSDCVKIEQDNITLFLKKVGYKPFAKTVNTVFFINDNNTTNLQTGS